MSDKIYDFDYSVVFKNGKTLTGNVVNSDFNVAETFLNNAINYYNNGKCIYYNSDEILYIEVTNFAERTKEE